MLATLLLCASLASAADAPPDSLLTVAERSGFKATARHAEVMALCEALAKASPLVHLDELGKSEEGRSLPLMIVADPPIRTAEEAKASGKLVVFLFGNIHAGEVCGKEALPILVRELTEKPGHPLLRHLVLAVAPIYNADGNERVAKDNRPGQVGPEEGMGQRANARGLDLNRDFIKLEAAETRAFVAFLNAWDPHLVIDTHATNGSYHRYAVTYDGPKAPAGDPRVVRFARDRLFPGAGALFEKATGRKSYLYGNFEADHSRWTTVPAWPRFGTTYVGLRNRLSVLSEAYAYLPYKDRVEATGAFARSCLEFASENRDAIRTLLDDARRDAIAAGLDPKPTDRVAIRSAARPFPEKVPILGYAERIENGHAVSTGVPRDYPADVVQDFVPTVDVARPYAYLIPASRTAVVATLRRHGIRVETLRDPAILDVEVARIDEVTRAAREFQGHRTVDDVATTVRIEARDMPAGTLVVRTAQPLGSLAVYLLEPRSEDGLTTWTAFGGALEPGRDFPVVRLPRPADLATTP
ncbi:M14 family metallopeptidase [Tundrisphaera sp. TA3]|uniref:M14 family metallopeptidase n=1 Tax=Tundrisphaera sp. TA3 TaxID=3435775 RepID=UPI003EC13A92